MIVNISQSAYLFDETLQVLKFSAIASKVQIINLKEPTTFLPPSTLPQKAADKGKKAKDQKRQTRFSILVEKNKPVGMGGQRGQSSLFGGRGSIAWENPQLCSTIMQGPHQKMPFGHSVLEEENDDGDSDSENMDDTVIESSKTSVSGLLKVIENLKNELIGKVL